MMGDFFAFALVFLLFFSSCRKFNPSAHVHNTGNYLVVFVQGVCAINNVNGTRIVLFESRAAQAEKKLFAISPAHEVSRVVHVTDRVVLLCKNIETKQRTLGLCICLNCLLWRLLPLFVPCCVVCFCRQVEALWALTNIAAGATDHAQVC